MTPAERYKLGYGFDPMLEVFVFDDPATGHPRPDGASLGYPWPVNQSLPYGDEYPGWLMIHDEYCADWVFLRERDGACFCSCDLSQKDVREGFAEHGDYGWGRDDEE